MQAPLLSQDELNEVCDLDLAQKQRILDLHRLLGQVTYYTLLGVEWNAEKKTIKSAYYERAATVHPDKFFRKELGSFRKKMEDVFARLTDAMEVLTVADRRLEYDNTLRQYGLIPNLGSGSPPQRAASASPAPMPSSVSPAAPARPSAPVVNLQQPAPGGTPFPRARAASETVLPTQEELAARKQALARKLLGNRSPSQVDPSELAPADSGADSAVAALRARYEQGVKTVKQKEEHKYIEEANALRAKGDFVGAMTALEHGVRTFPKSSSIAKQLAEVEVLAAPQLFAKYVAQAEACDSSERSAEGARFWLRAAELRKNDCAANAKAASALLKAGASLKDAADCAKRAVQEQPKIAKHRVLLANIYIAAGLKASAKREADVARELAPKDPDVVALQKRV